MTGLQVVVSGATTEQRASGAKAAQAVLDVAGIDSAAAFAAYRQMEELALRNLERELPPAMVRASVIWGRAVQAALLACGGVACGVSIELLAEA